MGSDCPRKSSAEHHTLWSITEGWSVQLYPVLYEQRVGDTVRHFLSPEKRSTGKVATYVIWIDAWISRYLYNRVQQVGILGELSSQSPVLSSQSPVLMIFYFTGRSPSSRSSSEWKCTRKNIVLWIFCSVDFFWPFLMPFVAT